MISVSPVNHLESCDEETFSKALKGDEVTNRCGAEKKFKKIFICSKQDEKTMKKRI